MESSNLPCHCLHCHQSCFHPFSHVTFLTGDSSHYAHHVYRAMFGQNTTQVTFTEYATALSSLTFGTMEDKLSWTFKVSQLNHSVCYLYNTFSSSFISPDILMLPLRPKIPSIFTANDIDCSPILFHYIWLC